MTDKFPTLYTIWVVRNGQPFFIHAEAAQEKAIEYGDRNVSGRNYVVQAYYATEEVAPKEGQLTNQHNLKIPDEVLSSLQAQVGDSLKFNLNKAGRWELSCPEKEKATSTEDSSVQSSWEFGPDGFLKSSIDPSGL